MPTSEDTPASPLPGDPTAGVAQALLGTSSEAVVAADRDGVLTFWNPGAERILGHPAEEAVGSTLDLVVPERLRAAPERPSPWSPPSASLEESAASAVGRTAATGVSFALCLVYLALFPFTAWGLAAVVAAGAVVVSLPGRPRDTVTTGITSAVVLVVAALAPGDAWQQPVLRLADTLVGVVVGLAGAWLVSGSWPVPDRRVGPTGAP